MSAGVLIIDDEPEIRRLLERYFEERDFSVSTAPDGEAGVRLARAKLPDLVVCDVNLPGMSGIEVCQALKRDPKVCSIPILIITGSDKQGQEIICLELGADDYLRKPFDMPLLGAHATALLRRGPYLGSKPGVVARGDVRLDVAGKIVRFGGRETDALTPKEFDLLLHLVNRAPNPVPRDTLYQKIWGAPAVSRGVLRTVDVHVQRIRTKLGLARSERLTTVSGRGYRWSDPA